MSMLEQELAWSVILLLSCLCWMKRTATGVHNHLNKIRKPSTLFGTSKRLLYTFGVTSPGAYCDGLDRNSEDLGNVSNRPPEYASY